jgi:hypothetical protein
MADGGAKGLPTSHPHNQSAIKVKFSTKNENVNGKLVVDLNCKDKEKV